MSSVKSFTANEIGHMEDVRELLKNILILFIISMAGFLILFIILIFTDKKNSLRKMGPVFLWASTIVLVLFLALYIMSLNFSYLFEKFHTVFFPQGNYMFSADSLLLTLFPFRFFYQYFLRLIICSSIGAAVSAIIGIVFIIIQKKQERRYGIEK